MTHIAPVMVHRYTSEGLQKSIIFCDHFWSTLVIGFLLEFSATLLAFLAFSSAFSASFSVYFTTIYVLLLFAGLFLVSFGPWHFTARVIFAVSEQQVLTRVSFSLSFQNRADIQGFHLTEDVFLTQ